MDYEKDLLELLIFYYFDELSAESEETKKCRQKLNRMLKHLPFKENDRIQCAVNELCAEQERYAFLEGIRLGARMLNILTK